MTKIKRVFEVVEHFINHLQEEHNVIPFEDHDVDCVLIDVDVDTITINIKCPELKDHRDAILTALGTDNPEKGHLF
jgi:hypothetical protein